MKTPVNFSNWHLGVTWCHEAPLSIEIDRSAPTVVPTHAFGFFQFSAIAFGGSALLDAQGGLTGQAPLNAGFFSEGNAFWRFLVQSLGHGCGAPLVAEAENLECSGDVALSGADNVTHFDLSGGFGRLAIDFHPALANFIRGQGPRLVKPGGPQPFVDSDFVHKTPFWAENQRGNLFL